ncbi:MAG: hypothetical protein UHH87_07770, partial [Akkermansia sp.]|nr:hypothetical protein [Akkermansia sp.]
RYFIPGAARDFIRQRRISYARRAYFIEHRASGTTAARRSEPARPETKSDMRGIRDVMYSCAVYLQC